MPPSMRRPRPADHQTRPRLNDQARAAHTPSDEEDHELPEIPMNNDSSDADSIPAQIEDPSGSDASQLHFSDQNEQNLLNSQDQDQDLLETEELEEDQDPDQDPSTPNSPHPSDDPSSSHPFPPPGLKEISSLASWTVSTAKPGNGVQALRHPSTTQFWQSDGPQPHTLSLHFFKLVSIRKMRIYLDFLADESYTPTKIQFLAGMGVHDLIEFAEMAFEQPRGWIDVDFSHVGGGRGDASSGGVHGLDDDDEEDDDDWGDEPHDDHHHHRRRKSWSNKPVLRVFLVQIRILENHQNGKDTHLRAVQIFERDDEGVRGREHGEGVVKKEVAAEAKSAKQKGVLAGGGGGRKEVRNNLQLADWMMDPDIR